MFQRVQQSAPFFPGPQLVATFAYASAPATTNLLSTDLFGTSVRFGTNDPSNANDAGSLSVAIGELLYYVGDFRPDEAALFDALRTKWGIP